MHWQGDVQGSCSSLTPWSLASGPAQREGTTEWLTARADAAVCGEPHRGTIRGEFVAVDRKPQYADGHRSVDS